MRFWQKAVLVLLAVAVAAAFTLGQKGLKQGADEESGMQENGMPGNERDQELEGREEENREGVALRVHREGKLVPPGQNTCIVVDAGHGGYDPGKVGINEALEKDVNLAIARLLRDYLEAAGAKVVMTRQEDESLGGSGEENRKVRDLKQRIETIEQADPVIAVSIHQNSYPEEYVSGAQVFYYQTSEAGKKLAQAVQNRLIRDLDPKNDRQIKENGSYFLLKKTKAPLVIVECGFLSNRAEAEKLISREYQDAVAWTVYLGIMDYLEGQTQSDGK